MYYRMKVAGLERDLPICPLNDKLSIAASSSSATRS